MKRTQNTGGASQALIHSRLKLIRDGANKSTKRGSYEILHEYVQGPYHVIRCRTRSTLLFEKGEAQPDDRANKPNSKKRNSFDALGFVPSCAMITRLEDGASEPVFRIEDGHERLFNFGWKLEHDKTFVQALAAKGIEPWLFFDVYVGPMIPDAKTLTNGVNQWSQLNTMDNLGKLGFKGHKTLVEYYRQLNEETDCAFTPCLSALTGEKTTARFEFIEPDLGREDLAIARDVLSVVSYHGRLAKQDPNMKFALFSDQDAPVALYWIRKLAGFNVERMLAKISSYKNGRDQTDVSSINQALTKFSLIYNEGESPRKRVDWSTLAAKIDNEIKDRADALPRYIVGHTKDGHPKISRVRLLEARDRKLKRVGK